MRILWERISWHIEYCMPAYVYCFVALPGLRLMKDMVYRRMCSEETEVRLLARLHYQKMTKVRIDSELDQAWTPTWKTNEASSLAGQRIFSQGTSSTFQEAESSHEVGVQNVYRGWHLWKKKGGSRIGQGSHENESHRWSNEMLQSKACRQGAKRPVSHITSLMHWQGASTNYTIFPLRSYNLVGKLPYKSAYLEKPIK